MKKTTVKMRSYEMKELYLFLTAYLEASSEVSRIRGTLTSIELQLNRAIIKCILDKLRAQIIDKQGAEQYKLRLTMPEVICLVAAMMSFKSINNTMMLQYRLMMELHPVAVSFSVGDVVETGYVQALIANL